MKDTLLCYGREGRSLDHLPVIDIHAHIGKWAYTVQVTMEERIAVMDRVGIDVAIISSMRAVDGDIVLGNTEVRDAVARFPGRVAGYVHVSANYPDLIQPELKRCLALSGFVGIKLYITGIEFDDARFDPVWACASERGVPIIAHTWAGNLNHLDVVAERYPTVSFIAAHTGSELAYQPYIDAALRVPNLFLDLTYSREHPNMIEHLVACVGADRVMWGSDEPVFSMAHQVSKVLFARLTDEQKRQILYGTALRVFGPEIIPARYGMTDGLGVGPAGTGYSQSSGGKANDVTVS